jgi:hypothetical protein
MRITQPFNNEIVIVKDFFNKKDLDALILFFKQRSEKTWKEGDTFLHKDSFKNFSGKIYAIRRDRNTDGLSILNKYTKMAEGILSNFYKDFYLNYGYYNITRTFDYGMDSHSDNDGQNGVLAGCIFYFNDDFMGGELVYDKLGIVYKPEAGDFVFHPGTSEYEHHVNDVVEGLRFTCGFSAYKKEIEQF